MLDMQTLNTTKEFKLLLTLCETIGLDNDTIQTMSLMPAGFEQSPLLNDLNERTVNEILNAFLALSDQDKKSVLASLRNKAENNMEAPADFLDSLINHSKYNLFDNTKNIFDAAQPRNNNNNNLNNNNNNLNNNNNNLNNNNNNLNNNNDSIGMPEGITELMELCQNLGIDIFFDAAEVKKDSPIAFNNYKKSIANRINDFNLFYIDLPEATKEQCVKAIQYAYTKSPLTFLNAWHNLLNIDNMINLQTFTEYFESPPVPVINNNNNAPVNKAVVNSATQPPVAVLNPAILPLTNNVAPLIFSQQTQGIISRYNRLFTFNVIPVSVRQALETHFPLEENAPDATHREVYTDRLNAVLGYENEMKKNPELDMNQFFSLKKKGKLAMAPVSTAVAQPNGKKLKISTDETSKSNSGNSSVSGTNKYNGSSSASETNNKNKR